jgi:hypothetical protein
MAGHLGNEKMTLQHLTIYKTDYKRNLVFIKGSLPGPRYSLVKIFDSKKKYPVQFNKLHYPTFIPEEAKVYPNVMEWAETVDMNEVYYHDNDEVLGISDEEEEGGEEGEGDDMFSLKK